MSKNKESLYEKTSLGYQYPDIDKKANVEYKDALRKNG